MRTFPFKVLFIRFFLPVLVIIPLLFSSIVANVLEHIERSEINQMNSKYEKDLAWITKNILETPQKWGNSQWQHSISSQLTKQNTLYIRLFNNKNELIFYFPINTKHSRDVLYQEYPVYQNSSFKGVAYVGQEPLKQPDPNSKLEAFYDLLPLLTWLMTMGLIIFMTLLFLKRHVLYPLTSLHKAAVKTSRHQFDYTLPETKVQEIADVLQAFSNMRDRLHQSLIKQAKLEEERQFFISSISHDLRTPLFSIRGALQAIKQGINPHRNERYIEICEKKSDVLASMIEKLLLYSKLNYHSFQPHNETINLSLFIQEVVEDLHWIQKEKDIRITSQISQTYFIQGDNKLLHRAISNITLNALQYSPNHSEVSICIAHDDQNVLISITDSGPGINPEDIPLIFSPLYRAEGSRNKNTGGSGLGLAISERIIQAHHGTITVSNSEQNGGAVFLVQLPFNPF